MIMKLYCWNICKASTSLLCHLPLNMPEAYWSINFTWLANNKQWHKRSLLNDGFQFFKCSRTNRPTATLFANMPTSNTPTRHVVATLHRPNLTASDNILTWRDKLGKVVYTRSAALLSGNHVLSLTRCSVIAGVAFVVIVCVILCFTLYEILFM